MLSDLAFALAQQGHRVSVITSRQRYDDANVGLTPRETVDGVEIHRVWTSRFGRANLVGRAVDYLTFYLSAAARLMQLARSGSVVVAKTDPPMLSILAGPIARWRGAQLINWLQDVFPEVASALGVGRGRFAAMGYRLLQRLRDRSLRSGAFAVAIGDRMADRLAALGVPREKIRVIPNWADGATIRPVDRQTNELRAAWGLEHGYVVGYSGNLGRAHAYQELLDAIALIEQQAARPDGDAEMPVKWLFIGGGAQYESFRREVHARGLRSVHFRPYQPREQLAESLSAADVHLITLRPELEGLIVPSKFYGVAAAGRPAIFIGDMQGEIANVLRRHDCGLAVPGGDGKALARGVLELAADPHRAAEMGARARRAFEIHYDKAVAVSRWEALLGEVEMMREHTAGQLAGRTFADHP